MAERDWKPDDVGLTAKGRLALRRENHPDGWIDTGGAPWSSDRFPENVRPLVVIDPEDREQVERLMDLYAAIPWVSKKASDRPDVPEMQAALREFANPTPPKPDEPLGLGAVVEDEKGRKFVRVAESFDGWAKDRDWQRIGGEINAVRNFGWSDISAVRVLSEGVRP